MPDIYQGQEVWDFSLVTPDNRRPVDFAKHAKMLARLCKAIGRKERSLPAVAAEFGRNPSNPRSKLFLTWRTLQFRRRHADLFRAGRLHCAGGRGGESEARLRLCAAFGGALSRFSCQRKWDCPL